MGFQDYKISPQAIADAKKFGIEGDIESELAHMAKHSAITTYPGANRRYYGFAFNIQG